MSTKRQVHRSAKDFLGNRKEQPAYQNFRRLMYGEKRPNSDGALELERSPYFTQNQLREVLKSQAFKDFAALYPKDQRETPAITGRTTSRRRG